MKIKIIAAVARDGTIGDHGGIPWSSAEDMRHFKQKTMGDVVVMGRKTWESIPEKFRPLPGRSNIVLSHNAFYKADGATTMVNLAAVDNAWGASDATVWIIGGSQVYAEALLLAEEMVLTRIDHDYKGDTKFPMELPEYDDVQLELGWIRTNLEPWADYIEPFDGTAYSMRLETWTRAVAPLVTSMTNNKA